MITFQSIIDEAHKRKGKIAKNFYQTLQLGEEHDVFTWGLLHILIRIQKTHLVLR